MSENPQGQVPELSFTNRDGRATAEHPEAHEDEMKKVKATENVAQKTETKPIDRVDIEKKIAGQEKDIAELRKSGQKLQGQLQQIEQAIVAKMGAVAGMKDLLGQ